MMLLFLFHIPIIHELGTVYLILHRAIRDFEKLEHFTLGVVIEKIVLECIQQCFVATVMPYGDKKQEALIQTSALFDTLKLYIRIAVDLHCLHETTYLKLIPHLGEVGKMLGGWMRKAASENPIPNSKS